MIKVSTSEQKVTAPKKTIQLKDILVKELRLVDADGVDVTQEFVDALPEGMDTIDFKISVELPTEDEA